MQGSVLVTDYQAEIEFACDMDFNMYPFYKIDCQYMITTPGFDSR